MSLQDMTRLTNINASLTGVSYNNCESMLSFTASISNAVIGEEYRAFITDGVNTLWNGSVQVFTPQTINKPVYKTQNDGFISHPSDNEYIIIAPGIPTTTTTTTTTAAPTTTTTSTTSTTTTTTAGTTTTIAPGDISADFRFQKQAGGMGFNVCMSGSQIDGIIDSVVVNQYKLFMSSDSNCTIPYGTTWDLTDTPVIYNFNGQIQRPCTSGGDISAGGYYRSRVSGSLQFQYQPGSLVTPLLSFDISGSGYQDLTYAGKTLRVYGAGCTLNPTGSACD
jgi:hypothetical protein